MLPVCPALPLGPGRARWGWWSGGAGVGGPVATANRRCQPSPRASPGAGAAGGVPAVVAIRAGMLIIWVRRWPTGPGVAWPASTPAARARLNAITAHAVQAAFAAYFPDGRCASGPSLSSAMTCSMIAWSRWRSSAAIVVRVELVMKRVVAVGREQLALHRPVARAWLQPADSAHDQPAGDLLTGSGGR